MNVVAKLSQAIQSGGGVRIGEAAVASTKVHGNDKMEAGKIWIYINKDAGRALLKEQSEGKWLHLDIFHEPAQVNPLVVGKRLWEVIGRQIDRLISRSKEELIREKGKECYQTIAENIKAYTQNIAHRVLVMTSVGQGNVYELASGVSAKPKLKALNHVHLMLEMGSDIYHFLPEIVAGVEEGITCQGYELRRVVTVIAVEEKDDVDANLLPAMPNIINPIANLFAQPTKLQQSIKLATGLGSIEEAAEFLSVLKPTANLYLGKYHKKHDDLTDTLNYLTDHGLVRKGLIFTTLTEKGKELLDYMEENRLELAMSIKRTIRQKPKGAKNYACYYNSKLKVKQRRLTDKKKIHPLSHEKWQNQVAVAETVIHAASRCLLAQERGITIRKEDVMVYGYRAWGPIDTCLLVDTSGSMAGEKMRAVGNLSRHLLLTSREKISLVTFQETLAKTMVPFTREYQKLQQGLREIIPDGLTPLAQGIVHAVELIRNSRARNPLLVLITDGLPNYPLWSVDAQVDALMAVDMIKESAIRFLCIGLQANAKFLQQLADRGQGNLFLLENLNCQDLKEVVQGEKDRLRGMNSPIKVSV